MNRVLAAALMVLLCLPAGAQTPPPGIPVDSRGGQTIDPTKNVLDLVLAAVKRLDDLADAYNKRINDLREAESRYQNAMREGETRRINELAAQKQVFDLELARVIRSNVDQSTLLLATQLKEVKLDLSERTAKLEQFRWESGGRTSGGSEMIGWIVAGVTLLLTIIGLAIAYTRRSHP